MSVDQLHPNVEAERSDGFGDITRGELAGRGMVGVVVGAVVLGVLSWLPFGSVNWARWIIVTILAYIVGTYVASRLVESRRHAADRLATAVVTSAFFIVLLPLISVIWTVVERGSNRFDWEFYSSTMRNVVGPGGGAWHAILGTLMITGMAAAFAVPFGLFTAIYIVEYGNKGRFARAVTGLVDVMTGIPSIVAGLFAYALFVVLDGPGHRSGLAGAIALMLLMTPVVVRASEEMLRLVPNELREASYALGVPKWKTIAKVILPTAIAGILTGIVLAVARVIGETAPLLVTVGIATSVNTNPFTGRMATLPVFTYNSYAFPSLPRDASFDRVWAAALTLVIIVGLLFTAARILSSILKPKGLR